MRLVTVFSVLVVCSAPGVAADRTSQAIKDFALGLRVGYCMVAGCQVFQGHALTAAQSGGAITVRVEDWLYGASASEVVEVPYETPRNGYGGEGVASVAEAWAGVEPGAGARVTVALGIGSGWEVQAGRPVRVTSDEREARIIRSLAEEETRLERTPEAVSAAVASLAHAPDPTLAGYLVAHLTFSKNIPRQSLRSELLLEMLGNPGVPADAWEGIPFRLLMVSGNQPSDQRARVVQKFVELAERKDVAAAVVGFHALSQVSAADNPDRLLIPTTDIGPLSTAYLGLVRRGELQRLPSLEATLGIQAEIPKL
jgi:hypothetical protein